MCFCLLQFGRRKGEGANSGHMVSVGIQNEASLQHAGAGSAGAGAKKRPKSKTIICMDAAIQTGPGRSVPYSQIQD